MPYIKCTTCNFSIQLPQTTPVCPNCHRPFNVPSSGSSMKSAPMPIPPGSPVPQTPTSPVSVLGPLPPGMLSRVPDLEGEIAIPPVNSQQQIPLDWSQILLRVMFFPFFIRETLKIGTLPRPTMTVHRWKIERASDGVNCEARIEGDLTVAQPSLHEKVSLWGQNRGGILLVNRGYNHDTKAEIHIRRPVTPWFSRAAVISLPLLILAAVIFFPGPIQATISTIGALIIIGIVFYVVLGMLAPWIPKRIVNFLVLAFILYLAVIVCFHAFAGAQPH